MWEYLRRYRSLLHTFSFVMWSLYEKACQLNTLFSRGTPHLLYRWVELPKLLCRLLEDKLTNVLCTGLSSLECGVYG